ncbi:hypothetical protein MH111_00280 [Bacillus altitudinis]|uniref:hypothetical protein n=1 Tax=Bacillus altitudinis TaxID=293387 RepID=UPI002280B8E6|nr:hypothetical protein [Bacillus altitudinis]MCY7688861.1 hypothetical protein [Bacillus altitudinis]
MTLQHYIGSNKELPLGTIGQNPTYKPFSELNISMFDKKQKKHKTYQKEDNPMPNKKDPTNVSLKSLHTFSNTPISDQLVQMV